MTHGNMIYHYRECFFLSAAPPQVMIVLIPTETSSSGTVSQSFQRTDQHKGPSHVTLSGEYLQTPYRYVGVQWKGCVSVIMGEGTQRNNLLTVPAVILPLIINHLTAAVFFNNLSHLAFICP